MHDDQPRLAVLSDDRDRTAESVLRITVEDLATGEKQSRDLPSGDYFMLTTEPAYVDGIQTFKNGTTVITIKGSNMMTTTPSDAFLAAVTRWQVERGITTTSTDQVRVSDYVDGWNACAHAQLDVLADLKRQLDALLVTREGTAPEPRAAASGGGAERCSDV